MKKSLCLILVLLLAVSLAGQTKSGGSTTLGGTVTCKANATTEPTTGPLQAGESIYSLGRTSNVRDGGAITANIIGTQSQTVLGTVSSCVNDTSGSWRRWCNIDFASGTDGWVTEDRLRRVNSTLGAKTLLVIRVVYSDHTGDSNPSDANITSHVGNSNSEFVAASMGQLTGITHTTVPGTLTLPNNHAFYSAIFSSDGNDAMAARILDDAHTLATAAGFNWVNYWHNIVWIPQDYGIGFAGGTLYRGRLLLSNVYDSGYGFMTSLFDRVGMPERADAWNSNDSTVFGSAGAVTVNGDPFDVFGTESVGANFNLYHKTLGAKWIPNAVNVHQVTVNGTYRIYANDTTTTFDGSRMYGIRMPGHISGSCSTCTEYFIEYRENTLGFSGLIINWGGSKLLDMTPGTETFDDAGLTVALSPWTDPDGRTISVSAAGGTTPKFVDVTIGGL